MGDDPFRWQKTRPIPGARILLAKSGEPAAKLRQVTPNLGLVRAKRCLKVLNLWWCRQRRGHADQSQTGYRHELHVCFLFGRERARTLSLSDAHQADWLLVLLEQVREGLIGKLLKAAAPPASDGDKTPPTFRYELNALADHWWSKRSVVSACCFKE